MGGLAGHLQAIVERTRNVIARSPTASGHFNRWRSLCSSNRVQIMIEGNQRGGREVPFTIRDHRRSVSPWLRLGFRTELGDGTAKRSHALVIIFDNKNSLTRDPERASSWRRAPAKKDKISGG